MIENQTVEYKRECNQKVKNTMLAFLNTDGGTLYLGVDDDASVYGIEGDIDLEARRVTGGFNFDGTRTKKHEVIIHALESEGIKDLSKAVMIGDREHDIIGAKKAGIDSVGVLYGYGCYEELAGSGADYIARDMKELMVMFRPDI